MNAPLHATLATTLCIHTLGTQAFTESVVLGGSVPAGRERVRRLSSRGDGGRGSANSTPSHWSRLPSCEWRGRANAAAGKALPGDAPRGPGRQHGLI